MELLEDLLTAGLVSGLMNPPPGIYVHMCIPPLSHVSCLKEQGKECAKALYMYSIVFVAFTCVCVCVCVAPAA